MSRSSVKGKAAGPKSAVQSASAGADGIGTSDDLPAEQIRELEAQYRSIFEAAGEGMFIANLEGVVVEANPAACRMYGYTYQELVGLPAGALVHPADLHPIAESTEVARSGGSYLRQGMAVHKDGTPFYAEGRVTGFRFKGEPHVLVVIRDITERVQAEEQLREKEEQYRSVFEAATDMLVIHDSGGKIVEINPAYCMMLGYTRDELIGQHVSILIPPEYQHLIFEGMQSIGAGDTPLARVDVLRKDGTQFPVEGHGAAFLLNGKPHFLGVARDITDRVRAEEQLKEREEQYRSIFESSLDGISIVDMEGKLAEVNPAFCQMVGYSRDELIGLRGSAPVHPDHHHVVAEAMQAIREGGDVRTEMVLVHKDGALVHVDGRATAFTYKGKPHFLGVSRDISDRVGADGQLREKEEQYRSIFEATTDGFAILDAKGRFVEVNPAYCKLTGYSRNELIGKHTSALIHPDYHHLVAEGMKSIKEGTDVWNRSVLVRKDGTLLQIEGGGTQFTYKGKPHFLGIARDITERLEAEKQRREQEEQYRAIFESTIDGLVILDLDGTIVEANAASCEIFGYTREELIGLNAAVLTPPERLPALAESLQRAVEEGRIPHNAADKSIRKDGRLLDVETRGRGFTYKGRPHLLAVVRDVTERVKAEEQLREKEAQYRSIFESSADGLGIYDQHGFLVEANPAYCQMLGFSHDELIGLHAGATVHPEYRHVVAEGLERVNRDVPFRTEIVILRKDGTSFPADGGATTFMYRGTPHELVVLRDISERVEAEKQIRDREAEYRGIFEATNDGLIIGDLEGHIVEANPAYCRMFGYTRDELIGLDARQLVAPDYRDVVDEALKAEAASGSFQAVAIGLRKDGTTFNADARGTSFMYRGRPHNLSVVQDVTERVRAFELLEERVKERTRELSTLLDVSHNVSSTLELRPLLDLILDQIAGVVEYAGASISLIDGDESEIVAFRGRGSADIALGLRIPVDRMDPGPETWGSGPLIIGDVRADTPDAIAYRRNESQLLDSSFSYVRSWMAVPLIVNERLVGVLTLNGAEPGLYTPHQAELVLGIASQAAIAIENARLYEQAQELAALEERQRLARELHDSVSQALFGIGLGARTARAQLERDVAQAAQSIDYVLSLTQSGMAEMRALIFELRPESLEKEGLVQALTKQTDAVRARYEISVSPTLCDEPAVPLPVKEALYRIGQEALHNAVKHARPHSVEVSLEQNEREIVLQIQDDGDGFDTGGSFPGHLGLHSMRERAQRVGGILEVQSKTGEGTRVRVRVPTHS